MSKLSAIYSFCTLDCCITVNHGIMLNSLEKYWGNSPYKLIICRICIYIAYLWRYRQLYGWTMELLEPRIGWTSTNSKLDTAHLRSVCLSGCLSVHLYIVSIYLSVFWVTNRDVRCTHTWRAWRGGGGFPTPPPPRQKSPNKNKKKGKKNTLLSSFL